MTLEQFRKLHLLSFASDKKEKEKEEKEEKEETKPVGAYESDDGHISTAGTNGDTNTGA